MIECLVKIIGRVQGVYFRQSTKERAQELGVFGWVKNCPDGSVEALFQGENDIVATMMDWCWQGPDQSQVEKVSVLYSKPCTDVWDRFTIKE